MNLDQTIIYAVTVHTGQVRKHSGIPYVFHPIDVANQLVRWGINDETVLKAALLHDVLEDTSVGDLGRDIFVEGHGEEVTKIVEELTFRGPKEEKQLYLDGFKDKSPEAIVIKMADRICNVRDFAVVDPVYALKYLHKATKLFDNLYMSFGVMGSECNPALVNRFSNGSVEKIGDTYRQLRDKLSKR